MAYGFNAVVARRLSVWARVMLGLSVLVSMGCTSGGVTNIITGVSFSDRSQRPDPSCDAGSTNPNCTPQLLESLAFAKLNEQIKVVVQGTGRCDSVKVDYGDGGFDEERNGFTFGPNANLVFAHAYTQWPGKKQVRVTGSGCLGEFTKELSVGIGADGHEEFRLAVRPNTSVCNLVTHTSGAIPVIRTGTVVRIEASGKIRYGVMEHDASGDRTIVAPTGYAFPMHRPYSLIYKVNRASNPGAPLEIQGEDGAVVFTNLNSGQLEVCINDHPSNLTDNIGSMFLQISVNESQATGQ
jgi:hypothetical protein